MLRVYVDMVGDLFHHGHISFLKQARSLGDYPIVGITSDEIASQYKRAPIMNMHERMEVVKACRYVDEVIPNAPLCPNKEWFNKHQIDIVAHGDDFKPSEINKYYGDAVKLGIMRTITYTDGISTSDIILRIINRYIKK